MDELSRYTGGTRGGGCQIPRAPASPLVWAAIVQLVPALSSEDQESSAATLLQHSNGRSVERRNLDFIQVTEI